MDFKIDEQGSVTSTPGFRAAGVAAGFKRSGAPDYALGFDSWGTKYYEQVYDALMNGKPMEVTLDQVRRQIMIIEECHRQNPFPKMK